MPVTQQSQGLYSAEVCCKLAGMATIKAKLNGEAIGQPVTVPIKPGAACQLRLAGKGSLHCLAGLMLPS